MSTSLVPLRVDNGSSDAMIFIMAVDVPPKDVDVEGMVNASPWVASGDRSVNSFGEVVDLIVSSALVLAATAKI